MSALLEIENLGKAFIIHSLNKRIQASQDISMTVHNGEFIGIAGKSGSGKSTILKCIYRTYTPSTGAVWYNSARFGRVNIAAAAERQMIYLRRYEIGYVSQFLHVMPRTTAIEIVEEALLAMGHERHYCRAQALKMLAHFELAEELWDSYPHNFSGGENCA